MFCGWMFYVSPHNFYMYIYVCMYVWSFEIDSQSEDV